MNWHVYALSGLGGLLFGSAVAYFDMLLSKSIFNKNDWTAIMGVNILRFTLDALTLTAVFFICRHFELPLAITLISTAIGLTVVSFVFLYVMTKRVCAEKDPIPDGGE